MVVTSQCSGHRVTGLYVGASNIRRFFPKRVLTIELQLDHLRIECALKPDFWNGHPEIDDPRLCLWLESKHFKRKECRSPMPFAMMPAGEHSFILGPMLHQNPQKVRPTAAAHDGALSLDPQLEPVLAN